MNATVPVPAPNIERDILATFKRPGRRYWYGLVAAATLMLRSSRHPA